MHFNISTTILIFQSLRFASIHSSNCSSAREDHSMQASSRQKAFGCCVFSPRFC